MALSEDGYTYPAFAARANPADRRLLHHHHASRLSLVPGRRSVEPLTPGRRILVELVVACRCVLRLQALAV